MSEVPDLDRLRDQLLDIRQELVGRLIKRVTGGDLAVLGSVGAALAAIRDMRKGAPEARTS